MNAFFVIPVLHEEDNLSTLLTDFQVQKYKNCVCVICVNNPQEWHSDEEHIDDIVDNANSINYLKSIGAKSVKVSYNQGDIENLIDASNYCLVTPNKNWRYVGTISNEQYVQAVANFKAQVEKHKNGYRPNPNKIKK